MKLPAFDYAAPSTLTEALTLLSMHAGDARPIAGGQSLIPILAFRLAQPSLLVDLRKLPGLGDISITKLGRSLAACRT
jgi:carbon-monoxide dehydrogenase medium subunit